LFFLERGRGRLLSSKCLSKRFADVAVYGRY
jgi:hypothetical protein